MAELIQKNLFCLPTTTAHAKIQELMTSLSISFLAIKSQNYCIFLLKMKKQRRLLKLQMLGIQNKIHLIWVLLSG